MGSKEVVNYEELLASMAVAAAAQERAAGSNIGLRAGILSYNGEPVKGNKLDVIVIASTHANLYYDTSYDPSNVVSPACYAYSVDGKGMAPHPAAARKQAESCDLCPKNQWGSDPKGGRGKACQNRRSLALVPASTTAEELPTAEVAVLRMPVTSAKNWQNYIHKLAALHRRPPMAMITTISTEPDAKTQFKVTFQDKAAVSPSLIKPIMDRLQGAVAMLETEYEAAAEVAVPGPAKY